MVAIDRYQEGARKIFGAAAGDYRENISGGLP
jgi:hypothetical protein